MSGSEADGVVAYARLVRLPNLFTAPPDVILGAALVVGLGHAVSLSAVAGLALASVLLYAAGTTLNDYFDADEDARERPERPIPAGDVSRTRALAVGVGLLVGGVAVAVLAAGTTAGVVAAALAGCILLYDGAFKGSIAGFLFMGTNRGLNVILGTTVAASSPIALAPRTLAVPVVVTLYIAAVTYMAESETGENDPFAVSVGVVGTALAALGVAGSLVVESPPVLETAVALALLGWFLLWTGRPLRAAYADPEPGTIGPAIGACVLGLVPLAGAFAAPTGVGWALAAAAFFLPAVGLSGVFDVS